MRYRNLKTGAIFDSPCVISGGDWVAEETTIAIDVNVEGIPEELEKVEKIVKKISEVTETVAGIEEENEEGFDGITIKQIKQELDAFGIKYNPKAKKQELYDLMIEGR